MMSTEMTEPHSSSGNIDKIAGILGLVYILLLFIPVNLAGRAFLCDLIIPPMLLLLCLKHGALRNLLRLKTFLAFTALALLSVCINGPTVRALYSAGIFLYMLVLFSFYLEYPLPATLKLRLGTGLIAAVFFCLVYDFALSPLLGLKPMFCFISEQMNSTEMSFLSKRFQFTMDNPNGFAPCYALILVLISDAAQKLSAKAGTLLKKLGICALCLLSLLPVFFSASKHGLLSLAVVCGWGLCLFPRCGRCLRITAAVLLLAVAAVFETTVLCTTFPLNHDFPFINSEPGMYTVHQKAYLNMIADSKWKIITGIGPDKARENYRNYVDPEKTAEILSRYNAYEAFEPFTTFMDPHNEYLRLAVLFGIPALLCMIAFWGGLIAAWRHEIMYFAIAVLCCCLWDDLLSKRAVFLAAAVLLGSGEIPWTSRRN